jgi:hypothetical protein
MGFMDKLKGTAMQAMNPVGQAGTRAADTRSISSSQCTRKAAPIIRCGCRSRCTT